MKQSQNKTVPAVSAVREEKGWVSSSVTVVAVRAPVIKHDRVMERSQPFIVHEHDFASH